MQTNPPHPHSKSIPLAHPKKSNPNTLLNDVVYNRVTKYSIDYKEVSNLRDLYGHGDRWQRYEMLNNQSL